MSHKKNRNPKPAAIQPPKLSRLRWDLLILFVFALALRLIYIHEISDSLAGKLLLGDSEGYDLWAREIEAGDWLGKEAFYQAPLYPYFLALIYSISAPDLFAVRVVQALLGGFACILIARAGESFFDRFSGILSGSLLAIYPVSLYFDGLIQKTILDSFFLTLLLLLIAKIVSAQKDQSLNRLWFAAGAVLGLLGLVRENALILIPILLIWAFEKQRGFNKIIVKQSAAMMAGLILILGPVGIRNLFVSGSFHLTTYQLGTNLYIGNNPKANGIYTPLTEGGGTWRKERTDAVSLAEKAAGRKLSPAEVSQYWTNQALTFISNEPKKWVLLMVRKWGLVWNRVEIADTEGPYLFEDESRLLHTLRFWHFGILCPLAAAGIALTIKQWRRLWILYAMLAALAVSIVIFYVFARYRFSLVPILILFAGAAVARISEFLIKKDNSILQHKTTVIAAIVSVTLIAWASNLKLVSAEVYRALAYFNMGWVVQGEDRYDGDLQIAEEQYQRAISILPNYSDALNNLGTLLAREGRMVEAKEKFSAAVSAAPNHFNARLNLGRSLIAEKNYKEGIIHLERAIELRPDAIEAREQLAGALFRSNQMDAAAFHYRKLLDLNPSAAAYNNYGTALASIGKLQDASVNYLESLRIDPEFAEAHENLARTYFHLGDLERAEIHYRELVRLRPESDQAKQHLNVVLRMRSRM